MVDLVTQMRSHVDPVFSIEVGPIIDGEHVVVRWAATGHDGGGIPGAGAQVGTAVTFHGTDILRVAGNQVVAYWPMPTPRPHDPATARSRLGSRPG